MDRSLLTLLVIVTTIIIFGLILMIPFASGALSQKDLSLLSKIYDKLTYILWEEKHQSALQVRNELIQQQILEEEKKQTALLDHLDCYLWYWDVGYISCGKPLNVTGVWHP